MNRKCESPNPFWIRAAGSDRLRLAHLPLRFHARGPACATDAHGHGLNPVCGWAQHWRKYLGPRQEVSNGKCQI